MFEKCQEELRNPPSDAAVPTQIAVVTPATTQQSASATKQDGASGQSSYTKLDAAVAAVEDEDGEFSFFSTLHWLAFLLSIL